MHQSGKGIDQRADEPEPAARCAAAVALQPVANVLICNAEIAQVQRRSADLRCNVAFGDHHQLLWRPREGIYLDTTLDNAPTSGNIRRQRARREHFDRKTVQIEEFER
jgi:hypothetical protein